MKKCIWNNGKKGLIFVLTASLTAPLLVPSMSWAAEENTPKQEVVYTNLNLNGSVKETYVVNIFNLEEEGSILDYGPYTEVRNMNTEDALTQDGDAVRAEAGKGKLYYEGSLPGSELPWTFSLTAKLDGEACSLEELAGKSGHLDLKLQIKQNPNGNALFFDNYALQASFVLDSNKIQNLEAEDATIANVGANKQLTYTILPGKEKDIEISVDVIDFEMQAISINGLPLSMDIEVDDEELKDRIKDLQDAVVELDDGVDDLRDGVDELYDGTTEMKDGTTEMRDETSTLDTDVDDEIDDMLEKITGNLEEIPSFVSAKNTNVEAVQFVIQTEAVEIPEEEAKVEEEAAPQSFWQKLLGLFGR